MVLYGLVLTWSCCCCFLVLSVVHSSSAVLSLSYQVEETSDVTIVGDLLHDSGLNIVGNVSFTINPKMRWVQLLDDGILKIVEGIDRDDPDLCPAKNSVCQFVFDVLLRESPGGIHILKLFITILDINDNTPFFENSHGRRVSSVSTRIEENVPIGHRIPLPFGRDLDSDPHGVNSYQLIGSGNAFELHQETEFGSELYLEVKEKLDRETVDFYLLTLEVSDKGYPIRKARLQINVTLEDVNDNPPVFDLGDSSYSVSVPESAMPGAYLLTVRAYDKDVGPNARISYSIKQNAGTAIKQLFQIDSVTGELKLKGFLNYESSWTYLIPVVARDMGSTVQKAVVTVVNVTVRDENDNSPTLRVDVATSSGRLEISENSANDTFVALVTVSDADSGQAGTVSCYISTKDFNLHPLGVHQYKLVVGSPLDREVISQRNVTITCVDGGTPPLSVSKTLEILINDENDHNPRFSRYMYRTRPVAENGLPGEHVVTVSARDADAGGHGENAAIRFTLGDESDAGNFSVHLLTGEITTGRGFDREEQDIYVFTVVATDLGTPPRKAISTVYVQISDRNDNPPMFTEKEFQYSVDENRPQFTPVGKVSATDADLQMNGAFWFTVDKSSGDVPFVIHHNTGVMTTDRVLDREHADEYFITIIATDYGNPALNATARVRVTVLDDNDNFPVFVEPSSEKGRQFQVSQDARVNSTVGKVLARDKDSGYNGQVTYALVKGNEYGLFRIERNTGAITLTEDIQPKLAGYYRMRVEAADTGNPPRVETRPIEMLVEKTLSVAEKEMLAGTDGAAASSDSSTRTYFTVIILIASLSGFVSVLLILAIVRIRLQMKRDNSYNCKAEAQRLFLGRQASPSVARPSEQRSYIGGMGRGESMGGSMSSYERCVERADEIGMKDYPITPSCQDIYGRFYPKIDEVTVSDGTESNADGWPVGYELDPKSNVLQESLRQAGENGFPFKLDERHNSISANGEFQFLCDQMSDSRTDTRERKRKASSDVQALSRTVEIAVDDDTTSSVTDDSYKGRHLNKNQYLRELPFWVSSLGGGLGSTGTTPLSSLSRPMSSRMSTFSTPGTGRRHGHLSTPSPLATTPTSLVMTPSSVIMEREFANFGSASQPNL